MQQPWPSQPDIRVAISNPPSFSTIATNRDPRLPRPRSPPFETPFASPERSQHLQANHGLRPPPLNLPILPRDPGLEALSARGSWGGYITPEMAMEGFWSKAEEQMVNKEKEGGRSKGKGNGEGRE